MKKNDPVFSAALLAVLATLAIIITGDTLLNFVSPEKTWLVNYYTGLVIYLVLGLMIIKRAGPKTIERLAQLTIAVSGFSFFLFILLVIPGKNVADQILVSLKWPFLATTISLFIFLLLLINNVLQNPKINWLPKKDYDPYWRFNLAIGVINIFTFIGSVIIAGKHYRSFLKVVLAAVLCLLLGRFVILEFQVEGKEDQAIVWYFCGFFSFLYLGRKLIKSRRKSAIFALLAASVTAGTILMIFSILTFLDLYTTVSRAILTWPAIISLAVLALLIFFGYDLYYRYLPGKPYRQRIREWLKSGKEVLDGSLLIIITLLIELLGFLSGVVILIFQACLNEKFLALSGELKNTGVAILGISALALFFTVFGIAAFTMRENTIAEMTTNMTPEEKKDFELGETRSFMEMDGLGRNPLNNPFIP